MEFESGETCKNSWKNKCTGNRNWNETVRWNFNCSTLKYEILVIKKLKWELVTFMLKYYYNLLLFFFTAFRNSVIFRILKLVENAMF